MNIRFDDNMFTFRLPVISLDVNTGHSKKLGSVAYEACKAFGPLILTRYTELMNSIIDTADDAKFLKEIGIIINQLKSDKDVANLWNGMSKSINLTKVPFLDKKMGKPNAPFKTPRKRVLKPLVIRRSPRLMGKIKLPFSCTLEKPIAFGDDEPDFSDSIET
ncbi:hypothetical protein LguiB_023117 [Lonicera macranthoides]